MSVHRRGCGVPFPSGHATLICDLYQHANISVSISPSTQIVDYGFNGTGGSASSRRWIEPRRLRLSRVESKIRQPWITELQRSRKNCNSIDQWVVIIERENPVAFFGFCALRNVKQWSEEEKNSNTRPLRLPSNN